MGCYGRMTNSRSLITRFALPLAATALVLTACGSTTASTESAAPAAESAMASEEMAASDEMAGPTRWASPTRWRPRATPTTGRPTR